MARSPARFIAPLALVAFGVALFLVLSTALKDDPGTSNSGSPTVVSSSRGKDGKKKKGKKKKAPKIYVGQDGRHAVRHRREDRRAARPPSSS